jgi:hypothetical protein
MFSSSKRHKNSVVLNRKIIVFFTEFHIQQKMAIPEEMQNVGMFVIQTQRLHVHLTNIQWDELFQHLLDKIMWHQTALRTLIFLRKQEGQKAKNICPMDQISQAKVGKLFRNSLAE